MSISAAPTPGASYAGSPGRPRILIVDDEPTICAIVSRTLADDDYEIQTTSSSPDALKRLEQQPFDLLITDISMPQINGLELAERARQAQPLLGIVIMTAYGSFENISRALRTGLADFILKPFDIEQMRQTVERALGRQHVQRDSVRLQTLIKVLEYSRAINSTLDPDELYRVIGTIVTREAGASGVMLLLIEADGALRPAYSVSWTADRDAAARACADAALRSHTVQTMTLDGAYLLTLPLLHGEERLGAVCASYDRTPPAAITELLEIIANQSALALRNARQYRDLRELDRLKSEFIGIASHELRTPLSLVLGYSSLLRNRLQGRDLEALQQVIEGALRIGDIVDDLVSLRRSDLRQLDLHLTTVDIWELLRETVAELQPLAATRALNLDLVCPSTPQPVSVDRDKITLALAHLIDNATKFTEADGCVRVIGTVTDAPAGVQIEVRDTGIGIAPGDLGRIFDRFYQIAPSTTRTQNGLGIGLALTKILIELHGGRIEAQSIMDEGSVFRIWLPITPPVT